MSRNCSRPGCNELAVAAFNFDGLRRIVWLNPIGTPRDQSAGDLCGEHADRLRPPVHWELRDLRSIDLTQAVRTKTTAGKQPAPATPLLSRAFRAAG